MHRRPNATVIMEWATKSIRHVDQPIAASHVVFQKPEQRPRDRLEDAVERELRECAPTAVGEPVPPAVLLDEAGRD